MKSLKDTLKDLTLDVVWDALKKFVTHQITKLATGILITLGVGWFGHQIKSDFDKKSQPDSTSIYRTQAQTFKDNWQESQNTNFENSQQFKQITASLISQLEKNGTAMADMKAELTDAKTHIVAVEQSFAEYRSSNKVVAGKDDSVHDAFIDGLISHDSASGRPTLGYHLGIELFRWHFQTEEANGTRKDFYKTIARSIKDSSRVLTESNDIDTVLTLIEVPVDNSKMWIDPALSGGVWYGNGLSFGLGYSPFMISSGGKDDKVVIFRYPILSISSDFKTTTPLLLGIAVNIAHWIPIIRDTYIVPSAGIDLKQKGTVFAIGISTTL